MSTAEHSAHTASPIVTLTPQAAVEVQRAMEQERDLPQTSGLRVGVMPGGCSGFQYSLEIAEQPLDDDLVFEAEGVRIFVDEFSAQYLNGVTIDYHRSMQQSGFTFNNPNATGGCGCGTSFSA